MFRKSLSNLKLHLQINAADIVPLVISNLNLWVQNRKPHLKKSWPFKVWSLIVASTSKTQHITHNPLHKPPCCCVMLV